MVSFISVRRQVVQGVDRLFILELSLILRKNTKSERILPFKTVASELNSRAPPNANRNESDENDTDDELAETLDDILRRVHENQAENPSPHIQSMIVESQRQSDLEIVQERDSLFSQNSSASRNTIEMSSDRVDSIRSVMSSFTLPPSAIPSWARNLSEDDIQKVLEDKISDLTKK